LGTCPAAGFWRFCEFAAIKMYRSHETLVAKPIFSPGLKSGATIYDHPYGIGLIIFRLRKKEPKGQHYFVATDLNPLLIVVVWIGRAGGSTHFKI
jgi:hypothetical protein